MPDDGTAPLTIAVEASASDADRQRVLDGLLAHNEARHGASGYAPVALFARDADGGTRGGLIGRTWWGWLHVEKLWVDAALRGQGVGGRLLEAAESLARERGCTGAQLDTVDPAALVFYERRGYAPFGVLEGFPAGARQWYLRKSLAPVGEPLVPR